MLSWATHPSIAKRTPGHSSSSAKVIHEHVGKPAQYGIALGEIVPAAAILCAVTRGVRAVKERVRSAIEMFLYIAFVGVRVGAGWAAEEVEGTGSAADVGWCRYAVHLPGVVGGLDLTTC
jgi:hypothetical protein